MTCAFRQVKTEASLDMAPFHITIVHKNVRQSHRKINILRPATPMTFKKIIGLNLELCHPKDVGWSDSYVQLRMISTYHTYNTSITPVCM